MDILKDLAAIVGQGNVLTGASSARYCKDWTGRYVSDPVCVARPGATDEVSRVVRAARAAGLSVVPVSGNTGLAGGTKATGAVMVSLERMNRIRVIKPDARVAVVEAGVVLASLHAAAEEQGLVFPLTFGAKGSAMIGGALSTNAGGSNVVRFGSTRGLCLGLEVVLADGRVLNLMSELHKDNSGYDLKDLFIGAEGTLGIITGAVVRLFPKPAAYATAMVAARGLPEALVLLQRLQRATGGAVEAFEYMPGRYVRRHMQVIRGARAPFDADYDVNIMVEVGATAPRDALPGPDGTVAVVDMLQGELALAMEEGLVLDAVIAQNQAQRAEMWKRREDAAEITPSGAAYVDSDIAVPLDKVAAFFPAMEARLKDMGEKAATFWVCHLGDGNVHYGVYPDTADPARLDAIREAVEDVVLSFGGSFSAEHGIGLTKKPSMARRKDPVALDVMRAVKAALDPEGVLNPGKVLPERRP